MFEHAEVSDVYSGSFRKSAESRSLKTHSREFSPIRRYVKTAHTGEHKALGGTYNCSLFFGDICVCFAGMSVRRLSWLWIWEWRPVRVWRSLWISLSEERFWTGVMPITARSVKRRYSCLPRWTIWKCSYMFMCWHFLCRSESLWSGPV